VVLGGGGDGQWLLPAPVLYKWQLWRLCHVSLSHSGWNVKNSYWWHLHGVLFVDNALTAMSITCTQGHLLDRTQGTRLVVPAVRLCIADIRYERCDADQLTNFDFKLPPRCSWDLQSSRILCGVMWQLFTDVSGKRIGTVFKGQKSPLKMRRMRCPETSVNHYPTAPRNIT
jgi:hypothetical protein